MALTLLIGTTKGAFLVESSSERDEWNIRGPFCDGWSINHVIGDPTTGQVWAAGGGDWSGAGVWRSDDGGENWTLSKLSNGQLDEWAANDPKLAGMLGWKPAETPFDGEVSAIWSLHLAHGTLFAGAKPATLFKSRDGGQSWDRVDGLNNHPSRDSWTAGAAGLVLHTILSDPQDSDKLWLGISAAGVFSTEDGGETWDRRNRLSNAEASAEHNHPAAPSNGEIGYCVHNMVRAPSDDLIYQQNHHGVFRSSDGARTWEDITVGLPSTFGFPIAVHPRDALTVWVLPLNGDAKGRFPPEAAAAVWKTSDGGNSWADKREGLPGQHCYFTVLRQAMATDTSRPVGVYFGTNTGSVFASRDEGESWTEIAHHLPTVLSVEVMQRAD